jgi:hypothetical protein
MSRLWPRLTRSASSRIGALHGAAASTSAAGPTLATQVRAARHADLSATQAAREAEEAGQREAQRPAQLVGLRGVHSSARGWVGGEALRRHRHDSLCMPVNSKPAGGTDGEAAAASPSNAGMPMQPPRCATVGWLSPSPVLTTPSVQAKTPILPEALGASEQLGGQQGQAEDGGGREPLAGTADGDDG